MTFDRRCNGGLKINSITTDNIENTLEIIRNEELYSKWVTVVYNGVSRQVRL